MANEKGKLLQKRGEIIDTATQFYEGLYGRVLSKEIQGSLRTGKEPVPRFLESEVKSALKKLKIGKLFKETREQKRIQCRLS